MKTSFSENKAGCLQKLCGLHLKSTGGFFLKLRKVLACMLSATILSTLAACGQKAAAPSSAASVSASAVTLQYYTIGPAGKDLTAVNSALNNLLMKKIGVRVKINYIDWDDYTTKHAPFLLQLPCKRSSPSSDGHGSKCSSQSIQRQSRRPLWPKSMPRWTSAAGASR